MKKLGYAITLVGLMLPTPLVAGGCPDNMVAAARLAGTYRLAGHANSRTFEMAMAGVRDTNNLDIFHGAGLTVYGRPISEFYWYRQPGLNSVTVIFPLGGAREDYDAAFHRDFPAERAGTWYRPRAENTRDGRPYEAGLGGGRSLLSFGRFLYADGRSFIAPPGPELRCKYYREGG